MSVITKATILVVWGYIVYKVHKWYTERVVRKWARKDCNRLHRTRDNNSLVANRNSSSKLQTMINIFKKSTPPTEGPIQLSSYPATRQTSERHQQQLSNTQPTPAPPTQSSVGATHQYNGANQSDDTAEVISQYSEDSLQDD